MELTAAIHRNAAVSPGRSALLQGDERHTWAGFADRVARLAGRLQAHGVGPGDRVALHGANTAAWIECCFATLWAGGVVVPVNTRWAGAEVQACLEDCTPVVVLDETGMADLRANLQLDAPVPDARRGGSDLAALYYTGGTTGRAKGVMLSHDNLMANSLMALSGLELDEHSVHLHTSPLFHVAGGARLFSVTLAGGTHVPLPRFEADDFLASIARERVTITVVVPTMLNRLVHHPDLDSHDLSSLELLCYGASPMPEAVLRTARQRLPGVRFLQSYGMTELAPVATMLRPDDHHFDGPLQHRLRSAGRAVPTAEVQVVDDHDQPLPGGEVGEVVVRGPMVMQGYWQQPELTAEALRGGWMHTGDAGYLDADGYLFLVDRVKDMIVTGGENVYSAEVENLLYSHPAVRECAVIGIPHPEWGEAVHAVVLPTPGAPDEATLVPDLEAHCRAHVAGFKVPRSFALVHAELPRSGAGKILKAELRRPFWTGRERGVN